MFTVKVYLLHSPHLAVRKEQMKSLTDLFDNNTLMKIDYEYIESYSPVELSTMNLQDKVNLHKQNNGEFFDSIITKLSLLNVSNGLKHALALEKASKESSKYDFFMILEDDVIYGNNVLTNLQNVLDHIKTTSDVIDIMFLGFPSLVPLTSPDISYIKASEYFKLYPCCDSYLIKSDKIEKIAAAFLPLKYITNFHLSYICQKEELQTYMTSPNIFLDGSKYGSYLSSLDPKNRLLFNPDFIKVSNLLQNYTAENDSVIKSTLEQMKFKNHPDIMHLNALYLLAKGDYNKTKEVLDSIYDISIQNGCVINNETDFLKTYVKLFMYLQEI